MTPEEKEAIKVHADAIATILYKNTDVEALQSLEAIEQVVRQHMLESVTPQVGIFLSEQRPKPPQANPEPSKVASERLRSPRNRPKR
jgi:hypothetical protein